MIGRSRLLLFIVLSLFFCSISHAITLGTKAEEGTWVFNERGSRTFAIATLDWPPFVGQALCGQGWLLQVMLQALVEDDYRVEVRFVPWKRAVFMAESGQVEAQGSSDSS